MITPLTHLLTAVLFCAAPAYELEPAAEQDTAVRLKRLESETQALREELDWLRQNPVRLPGVNTTPVSTTSENLEAADPNARQVFTLDELKGEMKKLAWTKGDFSVVPYGSLWATMIYETERSKEGDYTLWVYSKSREGEHAFHVDAKSTRFGFDILGPRIPLFCCAQSGGKIEIDFQRQIDIDNKPTVLLRHAYVEVKNEEFRLLAGQTWDVISPLYPGTLMWSVGWDAGNMGYRRAQFRGERYLHFSDLLMLTAQGSVNADIVTDTTGSTFPYRGDHSGWPVVEGRLGATLGPRGKDSKPIEFGVSGHIGEQRWVHADPVNNFGRRTWSFNVDMRVPLTDRLGVQGEFFTGENLGAYLGGIGQGIDLATHDTIRATGGWGEVYYDWTPRLHSHVGYSIDDPFDQDLTVGTERTYNHFIFGNLVFDVTTKFLLGLEVSSWKTLFVSDSPGESIRTEFVAKYSF